MLKYALCAAFAFCLSFGAAPARADHFQLPGDPDLSLAVGTGTFLGKGKRTRFERIQPLYFRFDGTLLRSTDRRWFSRLNLYGALSLEATDIGFRSDPGTKTETDEMGVETQVPADGLLRADISGEHNWSGGLGLRLSVFDSTHFHLDLYGEYTSTLGYARGQVDSFVVRYNQFDFELESLADEHATLTAGWNMTRLGATLAFPLKRKSMGRFVPFVSLGWIHFNADVKIKLDDEIMDLIDEFGVADKVPLRKSETIDSPTLTLGSRFDLGPHHALEVNGTYFNNSLIGKGGDTSAYWVTVSYRLAFDYPWN